MGVLVLCVGEGDKVDGYVTKHVLVVESSPDGLTDLVQIDLRQGSLWSEATSVDEFRTGQLVARADELDMAIWLDQERH